MTTTRFLALCAVAILAIASIVTGCGSDNGSGVTEDTLVGTDNGTDSTVDDTTDPCTAKNRKADGMCTPDTVSETSDDSTAIETDEETTPTDACAEWAPLEGTMWVCTYWEEKSECALTFWIDEEIDAERCVASCDLTSDYTDAIEWGMKTLVFPAHDFPAVPCSLKEE